MNVTARLTTVTMRETTRVNCYYLYLFNRINYKQQPKSPKTKQKGAGVPESQPLAVGRASEKARETNLASLLKRAEHTWPRCALIVADFHSPYSSGEERTGTPSVQVRVEGVVTSISSERD